MMLAIARADRLLDHARSTSARASPMGFGRDLRADHLPPRRRVLRARGRQFGAPSLITRNTNDVQQVQMLVLHELHDAGGGADHCASAASSWRCARTSACRGCCSCACRCWPARIGLIISRMVPQFRLMQARIDAVNRVLREQITGIRVVRAFVREPDETARFARRQHRPHRDRARGSAGCRR